MTNRKRNINDDTTVFAQMAEALQEPIIGFFKYTLWHLIVNLVKIK